MRLSPKQSEALKLVAEGKFYPTLAEEEDGWHARWRAIGVDNYWVDEYVRMAAITRLSEDAEDQTHRTLHDAWMLALRSRTGLVRWDAGECAEFARELNEWSGNAADDVAARQGIEFRLVARRERFVLECAIPKGRRALKALGQATNVCGLLRGMTRTADGRLAVELRPAEAEVLVKYGARELRDAGYVVQGAELAAAVTAAAEITTPEAPPGDGRERSPQFKLIVRVDGEPVTAEEIRFLLEQGSTLVFFRDRWIEVDRNLLKEALRALTKGVDSKASALSFALGLGHVGRLELEEVAARGWLRGLVNELRAHGKLAAAMPGTGAIAGLNGTLRDYQALGVEWLTFLTAYGFGALLADDMGLGKTIQVIAWLLASSSQPALIVAPLTLLANWRHELARFAPSLKVYVHQGDGRHVASGFRRAATAADVTLTSYNLLVRDYTEFAEVAWDALVLDEAQAIKNPDTQVARAVRALTPANRIALTGTPIENSVADVWSIEEFLNPGFLGERKSFEERFVRPIAADGQGPAARRLNRALEPLVLRRLKSDRRIAAELGAKREIREYCAMSAGQRADYERALADFRQRERRAGEVFALLTELKLICDGEGKLLRLLELLEGIFAAGESALVFTQYAKVGAWLQQELERKFGGACPFLHGGLDAAAREREIAKFNWHGPRAFVLSLKAGGFGLNLVKATHVIHFDRWWNPAVENQATDRAHRLGQRDTVFVHLFITEGTLEEHVDEILNRKSAVADTVITAAEWLEAAKLDEQA